MNPRRNTPTKAFVSLTIGRQASNYPALPAECGRQKPTMHTRLHCDAPTDELYVFVAADARGGGALSPCQAQWADTS